MKKKIIHIQKKLTLCVRLLLLLVAFTITACNFYLFYALDQQDEYAYYINLAGKQRMLSQRIELHYLRLQQQNNHFLVVDIQKLQSLLLQLHAAHELLIQQSVMDLLSDPYQAKLNHLYTDKSNGINKLLLDYTESIFPAEGQLGQISAKQDALNQGLLNAFDQVVDLYQHQAQKNISHIKLAVTIFIFSFLLLLYLCYRYFFFPLSRQATSALHKEMQALQTVTRERDVCTAENLSKSALLFRISHALRGSLNGVLGMLHLYRQQPSNRELLVKAQQSALNMLDILNTVTDYAELEQDQGNLRMSRFCLSELLAHIRDEFNSLASKKGIEFELTISPSVPYEIEADQNVLLRILRQLLNNAVQYTECGEVALFVNLGESNELSLHIHDTGVGITDSELQRLKSGGVNRLQKRQQNQKNTGIGLTIVHRLVSLLGGKIEINSVLGQGTDVYLQLPYSTVQSNLKLSAKDCSQLRAGNYFLLSRDPALVHFYQSVLQGFKCPMRQLDPLNIDEIENNSNVILDLRYADLVNPENNAIVPLIKVHTDFNLPPKKGIIARFPNAIQLLQAILEQQPTAVSNQKWPGKKVLVAEDNAVNQEVIVNLLQQNELDVTIASNGLLAAEIAIKHSFDIILMDIQMPVLDGVECTRKLRESGINTPIIALTAHSFRADEKLCFEVGMDGFLSKPLDPEKLNRMLSRFLSE
ncbi:response regulator [Catenovulum sediminis]|uniref:histidine kinase n=1 Tax=Catenovulum sediminis TaxID=1740262 RepID=A0ABV1RN05_9ALTE|nr:response regulator [Catenovulum sediminis]